MKHLNTSLKLPLEQQQGTGLSCCKYYLWYLVTRLLFNKKNTFIHSYRDDCEACMKFHAKWEYIGSQLKGRINLATVNIMLDGISTGRRFQVESVPTFLL